ncbi:MAG: hypothetical protein ACM3MF_08875 [Anaerolineae bacterium]
MYARKLVALVVPLALLMLLALSVPIGTRVVAQQPTGDIATVTSTPTGPMVAVDPSLGYIDVYAGPSSHNYPAIGVLLTGLKVPALGKARGDDNWIMIRYEGVPGSVGWVYALYVSLSGAQGITLPLIDVPPTPTPATTATINATLVARFLPGEEATRLPTFTAPAPLAIPTFVDESQRGSRIPVGLLIFGFAVIGALGTMISFLRGR